jgi:hypothetical protein
MKEKDMKVIRNVTEGTGDTLVIDSSNVEGADRADVEIFAQKWLDENYSDDEYVGIAQAAWQGEEENIWSVDYNVVFRKKK